MLAAEIDELHAKAEEISERTEELRVRLTAFIAATGLMAEAIRMRVPGDEVSAKRVGGPR